MANEDIHRAEGGRRQRWRRALLAGAVVVILGVAAFVYGADRRSDTPPLGWEQLNWDATGGLLGDEGLLRDALEEVGQDREPRVLFAGEVEDRLVVAVGASEDECARCVVTVVDGELTEDPGEIVEPGSPRVSRPIVFSSYDVSLFAPLSVPGIEGTPYLFHPRITAVQLGVGPTIGEVTPLELEDGVAVIPPALSLPDGPRVCELPVLHLSDSRGVSPEVYALASDYLSVGVDTRAVSDEIREVVGHGVARGLSLNECDDEPGRLFSADVFGDQRAVDGEVGNLDEPVTKTLEVRAVYDDRLADGRPGRVLWLEWQQGGASESDTVTTAWQDPSGVVYFGQVAPLTDGVASSRIEAAPGGGMIVVAGSDFSRADAGGADVLAAEPNLLVLADPGRQRHTVTIYGDNDQPLDSLVIGG